MALVIWVLTAFVVGAVHVFAAKVAVIVAMAYAYMRFVVRDATMATAVIAGVAWATLSVIVEAAVGSHLHHGWYELLGSPDHALLRDVVLLAWIATPSLFARRGAAAV